MGVLEGHQARQRLVDIGGVAERGVDGVQVERSVGLVPSVRALTPTITAWPAASSMTR